MLYDIIAYIVLVFAMLYVCWLGGAVGESVGLALSNLVPSDKTPPPPRFPDKTPKKDPVKPAEKRPKHLIPVKEALTAVGMKMEEFKMHVGTGAIQTYIDNGVMYVNLKDLDKLKRTYPVISSFNEEHRITNPVEFDT